MKTTGLNSLQVGQKQVKIAVHDADADSKSKSYYDICGKKKIFFNNVFLSSFHDASLDDIADRKGRYGYEPRHLDQEDVHGPQVVVFWCRFELFRFFAFRDTRSMR